MDLIVGDVHWSEYSSIVRKMGNKYSRRLETLINSVNFVEQTAEENTVDRIIYLGDFFDRNNLNASEISALKEVVWADIEHIFITGNHEMLSNDLSISSANLFSLVPKSKVIYKTEIADVSGIQYLFIPYQTESSLTPLSEISGVDKTRPIVVFSHNDIKMQYGMFTSKIGFDINDIENNCTYFFNGHLHNGTKFCRNGYNVGNLCGQNFSEDAFEYSHNIVLFEYGKQIKFVENPFAFNFYKLEINSISDFNVDNIKNNAVITIKVRESIAKQLRDILNNCNKIKDYRIIISVDGENKKIDEPQLEMVNPLTEFVNYVKSNMQCDEILNEELMELVK